MLCFLSRRENSACTGTAEGAAPAAQNWKYDSHKKSADLGWEGPVADAQWLGFQHTQQKNQKPKENQHGLGWRVKTCSDIKENDNEWEAHRRENGRKIPAPSKGRQHWCGQTKAPPYGQCIYLCFICLGFWMATPTGIAGNDRFYTLRSLCSPLSSDKCSIRAVRRHLMASGFLFLF